MHGFCSPKNLAIKFPCPGVNPLPEVFVVIVVVCVCVCVFVCLSVTLSVFSIKYAMLSSLIAHVK